MLFRDSIAITKLQFDLTLDCTWAAETPVSTKTEMIIEIKTTEAKCFEENLLKTDLGDWFWADA